MNRYPPFPATRRAARGTPLSKVTAVTLALLMTACGTKVNLYSPQGTLPLPGGEAGLNLDDMIYSAALQRVIVPAGRTGDLDLIDPVSGQITVIPHVTPADSHAPGRGHGTTSADYGLGYLFAGDRTDSELVVVNAKTDAVRDRVRLASTPDYVRYATSREEVWVTEPQAKQIEVFGVRPGTRPLLVKTATVAVAGGPESLVIDNPMGVAYTNLWRDKTVVVDLQRHRIIDRWPNTCEASRGLALGPRRGLLFVGCKEGKVVSMDVEHGGGVIAAAAASKGVDIIAYDDMRGRLYVPGSRLGMLTLFKVAPSGKLQALAKYRTAPGDHCVVSDDAGKAYVCDPDHGRLLVIK